MKIFFKNMLARIKSFALWLFKDAYPEFKRFGKRVGWWKVSLVGGVLIGIVVTLLLRDGPTKIPEVAQDMRAVQLRSVAELAGATSALPVVGIVQSQSEAEVRTQSAGEITSVNKKLGDRVAAGEIIASMDNSRERAAVLQAEGVLDAARAALSKVERGVRGEQVDILSANVASAQSSLTAAQTGAVNTLLSAYAAVDESVHRKTDPMFTNPDTPAPKLNVQTADSGATSLAENSRVTVAGILSRQSKVAQSVNASADLEAEISKTESELRVVVTFYDQLITSLNKSVPNQSISDATIAGYKADANAARAAITSSLSALSAAKEGIVARKSALEVANKTKAQGTVADTSDVAATAANVKQAQGALALARANLEKTIVRAPISGTINSLPLKRGDFVSAFSPAVTIANNGSLEVVAYVTEEDAQQITIGATTRIDDKFDGTITRIAPAVDPATKKIEVRIGIAKETDLVNGKAVTVELRRTAALTPTGPVTIPISALKIGNSSVIVFTLDENSKLVSHEVELGTLLGDRVEIKNGLTPEMRIVLDARGLKQGQQVNAQ